MPPISAINAVKLNHLTAASAPAGGPGRERSGAKAAPAGALPSGLSTVNAKEPVQVCPSTSDSVRQATV